MNSRGPNTFADAAPLPSRFPRQTFADAAKLVFIFKVMLKGFINEYLHGRPIR